MKTFLVIILTIVYVAFFPLAVVVIVVQMCLYIATQSYSRLGGFLDKLTEENE